MDLNIINIIQSCNTLHVLKEEFKKPFGWFRFISKNKAKKLEDKLDSTIKTILSKDEWDVQYLYDLERILFLFYNNLKDYMVDVTIPSYDPNDKYNPKNFIPIYFYDKIKDRNIIVEIVSTNIIFTVFDNTTGKSIVISTSESVSKSQEKIENQCKEILINFFLNYLHEYKNPEEEKVINLANKINGKNS